MNKKIAAGIIILGIAVRIGIWYASGQPVNPCSALWGILARDSTSIYKFPLFLRGEPFIGSIGIYLEFVFLVFVKLNAFTNGLAELVFAVLFMISMYLLGKRLFGGTGAVISTVLSALAPYHVMISSVNPCANYHAILFFQNVIFLLVYKLCHDLTKTLNVFLWVLLGFVSGVALWSNFIIISCIFTVLIFLSIRYQRLLFSKNILLALIFFIIGNLPFLAANFGKVSKRIQWVSLDADFFNKMSDAFIRKIPEVLGFSPINLLAIILYPAALIYVIYMSKNGFKNIMKLSLKGTNGLEIFLSFFIITIIMLTRLKFHDLKGGNDFIIIFPVFIIFAVRMLLDVREKSRSIFTIVFPVFIIANMINTLGVIFEKRNVNINNPVLILRLEDAAVLYPFMSIINYKGIEIPSAGWEAISNFNPEDVYKAYDRDISTRWTTHRLQEPGMYYKLDLGKEELIDRMVVVFNPDKYDYPRSLRIEFSKTGKKWEHRIDISNSTMDSLYSGKNPFLKDFEIMLAPDRVRFIRMTQTWTAHDNYWSIREIFVYGPADEK